MAKINDLSFDDLVPAKKKSGLAGLSFDDLIKPEDPGALGAIGLGFGRTADKMLQGGKQAALAVGSVIPGAVGQSSSDELERMKAEQKFRDEGYAPLQEQHPVATVAGEALPLVALPMGGSLRAAAAIGALPGLLEYGTGQEKLTRGVAGAAGGGVGYGVGKAIGSVVSPGMKASSPEASRLAEVAAREGIPLDAAQVTGNPVLQNTKAALASIPWTASGQAAKDAAKQEAYNAALLKRIGSDGRAATPDVMADAHAAIVKKMDDAANSIAITIDDPAVAKIAQVEKTYFRRLPTDQKAVVGSYLDDLTELIGKEGGMPGDVYNKTRSDLGKLAFTTQNSTVREGAKGLQKALDDAFDRQAPSDAVAAMKEARAEYAKYMTYKGALEKGRSQNGNLPPKQMYAQAQHDIPGFERGAGGDFNDLVRAGRQFLPDPVNNSGTPQRMLYQNLLTAGTMSGVGALGGQLAGPDPSSGQSRAASGALLGLGGFGLSKGAQGLLNSPQLTRYLMSHTLTEEQKKLLAKAGGLLGLGLASGASQ